MIAEETELSILSRVLIADRPMISPQAAHEILSWQFQAEDHVRMALLADKARMGTLTHDERLELDSYERVSSFLGILKSKARQSLKQYGH